MVRFNFDIPVIQSGNSIGALLLHLNVNAGDKFKSADIVKSTDSCCFA